MKKCNFLWIFILILFAGCETEMDKYFKVPDWLKGSAYEVLEQEGNFTLFLSAVDKSDFTELVKGKGIITVMAPTDEAFRTYLSEKGLNSVDDLTLTEINSLVGMHLVYYSFSTQDFMDYKPDGVESENLAPGTYFKFRTKSREAITTAIDKANDNAVRKVVHKDRFLPVFSESFFTNSGSDPATEYETLYPDSKWTGQGGFNVANASVLEYQIVTDNGYLYYLDQVIEPLETIYAELERSGYTKFAQLYDRFATYEYDPDATKAYADEGDSLYVHGHYPLPSIASEWTSTYSMTVPDYAQMAALSSLAYNVIAPDDNSVEEFFQKNWAPYYSSIDDVNIFPLYYLMNNHVYATSSTGANTIRFLLPNIVPAMIANSDFVDGNASADMDLIKVCNNGMLYGLRNNILTPDLFESVIGLALKDPKYNMMLIMLTYTYSNYFNYSYGRSFDVFYPSDNMLLNNTTYEGRVLQYRQGNKYEFGSESVQIEGSDGMRSMYTYEMAGLIGAHIVDDIVYSRNSGGEEEIIYSTLNDFEYLYRKGNKIYSSAIWNNGEEDLVIPEIEKAGDFFNGTAWILKGEEEGASALTPEERFFGDYITSMVVTRPDALRGFSYFSSTNSMQDPALSFLQGERFIAFVPSFEALQADVAGNGYYPITDTSVAGMVACDNYVQGLFVNLDENNLYSYPFPGTMARTETTLTTFLTLTGEDSEAQNITVTLIDKGDQLVVRDMQGNEANVISVFPYMFLDGAVYVIDKALNLLNR